MYALLTALYLKIILLASHRFEIVEADPGITCQIVPPGCIVMRTCLMLWAGLVLASPQSLPLGTIAHRAAWGLRLPSPNTSTSSLSGKTRLMGHREMIMQLSFSITGTRWLQVTLVCESGLAKPPWMRWGLVPKVTRNTPGLPDSPVRHSLRSFSCSYIFIALNGWLHFLAEGSLFVTLLLLWVWGRGTDGQ